MERIRNLINKYKYLIFIDLEATQYTHEMIAIGLAVYEYQNHQLVQTNKVLKRYVKSKEKIGKRVVELTGITERTLKQEGIDLTTLDQELKQLLDPIYLSSRFITFSNGDASIIKSTLNANPDLKNSFLKLILPRIFDFQNFIKKFIHHNNSPYSLTKYMEIFDLEEAKPIHDPLNDAINLASLFNVFLGNKEKVKKYYLDSLKTSKNSLISKVVNTLYTKGSITVNEFESILFKELND